MKRVVLAIAMLISLKIHAAANTPEFVFEDPDEAADIIAYLPKAKEKGLITTEPTSLARTIRVFVSFSDFNEGKTDINDLINAIGLDINHDLKRTMLERIFNAKTAQEKIDTLRQIYESFVRTMNSNADLIRLCSTEARTEAAAYADYLETHQE